MDTKKGVNEEELDKMIRSATTLGIGFAIVSKDALEKVIQNVSKEGDISEKEARSAVTKLVNESKRKEQELITQVKKVIKTAKAKSPVVSRAEVTKMKAEIAKLKKQLGKRKK